MSFKTLKDLEQVEGNPAYHLALRRVKAEAIKRVKVWEIQKERFKEIGNEAGVNCVKQIQDEFIDFFNLKLRELEKEEKE